MSKAIVLVYHLCIDRLWKSIVLVMVLLGFLFFLILVPSLFRMPAAACIVVMSLVVLKHKTCHDAMRCSCSADPFEVLRMVLVVIAIGCGIALSAMVAERSTVYNIWLPSWFETVSVFVTYGGLSMLQVLICWKAYCNRRYWKTVYFFLLCVSTLSYAIVSFVSHGDSLRLHHFWIGQLLQTLPFLSTTKVLGVFLALDGWVQVNVDTGYKNYVFNDGRWDFVSYGCDNVVVDHFSSFLFAFSLGVLLEGCILVLTDTNTDRSMWECIKDCWTRPEPKEEFPPDDYVLGLN